MKYIIFHLNDSKNLRGGEKQALYLAEELSKLTCENYLICRKNSPIEKEAIKLNIKIINLPFFFEWDIFSAYILAKNIKAIINKEKNVIPILHSHTAHTAAISYLTNFFIKTVRIVHRRVPFKPANNLFSKIKYNKAHFIITISKKIYEMMLNCGFDNKKMVTILSSTNLKNFNQKSIPKNIFLSLYNIPGNTIIIGTLAALTIEKDPFNLIKAANIVLKNFPQTHFIWGGDGNLKETIIKVIKELKIENNFHIIGYCHDNISFLKSLDIFVLPSREEGLGSVLIEAMACELPLIGTDSGGIPELIENEYNGLIVPKENPEKLAEAIIKLIQNKELREKLAKNSLIKSKNYSSERMAQETLKVYEKAVENFKSN